MRRGALVAASISALAYVAWDLLGRPAPDAAWRFLFEAPRTFLVPGALLVLAGAGGRRGFLSALGLAIALSVAVEAIAADLALHTGLGLELVSWLSDGVALLAGGWAWWRSPGGGVELRVALSPAKPVALLALLCAIEGARVGGFLGQPGDTWMHLAIAERVRDTAAPVSQSPLLARPVPWRYAESWHVALARGRSQPGELSEAWAVAPAAVLPAAVLSFAGFASEALSGVGLVVAVVAFAAGGGLRPDTAWAAFPSAVGAVLFFAALSSLWRWSRDGERLELALVGVLGGAGLLVHPIEPILLGLVALALGLYRRRALAAACLLGLVAVAILPGRYGHLLTEAVSAERSDPSDELLHLPLGLDVVDPRRLAQGLARPSVVLSLLCLPWLVRRRSAARPLWLALAFIAVAIPFLPPAVALIRGLGLPPFLATRAALLWPFPLLLGLAAESRRARQLIIAVCAATWILCGEQPRVLDGSAEASILQASRESIRYLLGEVVATDLVSGDFLPGLASSRLVAGITWHAGSPSGQLELRRFLAEPDQTSAEALEFLRREHVDVVLYNPAPSSWPGFHDPFYGPNTKAFLEGNPAVFRPAFSSGGMAAYVVRKPLPLAATLIGKDAPSAPGRTLPPGLAEVAGYGLLGLDGPATAAAGSRLAMAARLAVTVPHREAALLALVAVPQEFVEDSRWGRLCRVLGAARLAVAMSRPGPFFRLDHAFYLDRAPVRGEAVSVDFDLALPSSLPPGTYRLLLGLASDLPPFPEPLGPALASRFIAVARLEICP